MRDLAILTGQDGRSPVVAVDLKCGPGDFSLDGIQAGFYATNDIMCNGIFEETTRGADEPVTGTLTIYHDGTLTDSVSGKPLDFVLQTGSYLAGTTVDPGGDVWRCDMRVTFVKGGYSSTITLYNCRLSASYSVSAEANTIALSFSARGRPGFAPMVVS